MILEINTNENQHFIFNMDRMTTMYVDTNGKLVIEYGGSLFVSDRIYSAAIELITIPTVRDGKMYSTTRKLLKTILESFKKGEKYLEVDSSLVWSIKFTMVAVNW